MYKWYVIRRMYRYRYACVYDNIVRYETTPPLYDVRICNARRTVVRRIVNVQTVVLFKYTVCRHDNYDS
jgi:hypothetical protein